MGPLGRLRRDLESLDRLALPGPDELYDLSQAFFRTLLVAWLPTFAASVA